MSLQTWFQTTIHLTALFLLHSAAIAQQDPVTADQVVSRYFEAVGANRSSAIRTVVESGDLEGNLTNFSQGSRSPWQSQNKQHGTFESYFKSPNLRFNSTVTEKNQVIALHGCDGKIAWYIDSHLNRTEFKPKPGSEGECEEGFQRQQSGLRAPGAKLRLLKKKEVQGRMAWEIKVDIPKSPGTATYYFDADTFLLARFESLGISVTYSDYRDLDGIELPFTIVQEFANSKLVTTIREVKINAPIEDARFAEPQITGGKIAVNSLPNVKKEGAKPSDTAPVPPLAKNAETSDLLPVESSGTHNAPSIVEVNFPNFTSCTIEELKLIVPELSALKPSANQEKLTGVLEKVGAKTLDIARNTPNLIARERVIESPQAAAETRRDYDYLILARIEKNMVALNEYRLDLKSGDRFETDEVIKKEASSANDLEHSSNEVAATKAGRPPIAQGFATSWVHFYPTNRPRTTYRYLGEENMDGHRTLVLAFAQKPELALLPAIFQYQGKTAHMFLQGIAWIDPSDFRILRLRTDLLAPVPEVSLHRWTADIQFGLTRIEQTPLPLQLPRKVTVITTIGASTMQEIHEYSGYRLFRAQSRVVPIP